MFFMVLDNSDVQSLTAKQLKYIPKVVLLQEFHNWGQIARAYKSRFGSSRISSVSETL